MDVINNLLRGKSLEDIFQQGLEEINQDDDVKKVLAARIESDIQQYVDAETWGEEKPVVEVIGDDAYVVCFGRKMPPIMFYCCVFNNLGKVTKDLFIALSNNYEDL